VKLRHGSKPVEAILRSLLNEVYAIINETVLIT
jgi:hypothetical protein